MISTIQIEQVLANCAKPFQLDYIAGTLFIGNGNNGSIMISHGFTESQKKYEELIYYFLQEGYCVCIHDHKNHGHSRKTPQKYTHIDRFQEYVEDLEKVVQEKLLTMPKPYYIFAHSMGGLIASLFLEQHPGVFEKAILSSPMFEVNRSGIPYGLAKAVANAFCILGKGESPLPGQGSFSSKENFEGSAATCYERYKIYFEKQLQDPFLQSGGPTYQWTKESFRACEQGIKNASSISIPVLLFQADKDDFVLPKGQEEFIKRLKNGKLVFVPNTKHEIYLSEDKILFDYLQKIFNFLETV
ncbi:MAG: alpha/beta hydrolase [Bacillota bacterium]|nr:alpha/beta hydrolase [Bacillota bacterium]